MVVVGALREAIYFLKQREVSIVVPYHVANALGAISTINATDTFMNIVREESKFQGVLLRFFR